MNKDKYKKLTFDDACKLLTEKEDPITIYLYQAYTKPPGFIKFDITDCHDDRISGLTRFGWDELPATQDKRAGTSDSGYYIEQRPGHQFLLDPSPFKRNKQVVSPKDTDNTTYNPINNNRTDGGKVRTRKNRKSRKNKYKKNKSRRKYNKKKHHK